MLNFEYQDNVGVTVRWVHQIAHRAGSFEPVLRDLGERMVQYSIPENFEQGGRPTRWKPSARALGSTRGGQTLLDTGRLKNSLAFSVNAGVLKVGTAVAYAAQRHFGGTIKAKGKALAIPVNTSTSRSRPKHYDNLRWMPGKGLHSKGLLVEQTGAKRKRLIVRFALKSQITQPARPFVLFQKDDLVYAEKAVIAHILGGGA